MPIIAALLLAVLGWAYWTGKIKAQQLPPILLGLAGLFLSLRGQWLIGVGAILVALPWYRGMSWRLFGSKLKKIDQAAIDNARFLLGVSRFDNEERIKERHRILIAQVHPDRGGSAERATELNQARDLLLRDLMIKPE